MTRNIDSRLDNLESMLAPTQRTRMVWANSHAEAKRLGAAAAANADPGTRVLVLRWMDPAPLERPA